MYIPPHFEEPRIEVLHGLIQTRPLATVVTLSAGGIVANHLPLHLSPAEGPFGVLRGHVARANPIWRDLVPGVPALAVFQGPDGYVSPSCCPKLSKNAMLSSVIVFSTFRLSFAFSTLPEFTMASHLFPPIYTTSLDSTITA